mgnify:FL=1|tara:strand:+ start:221 stop:694 length:474 start_codon:yes stop_codon:yes gene_type:complete
MGNEKKSPQEFREYISEPVSREKMSLWVKVNNIDSEKVELFFDHVDSLRHIIHKTYLGDDLVNTDRVKRQHYDWCWAKVISDFKLENINFNCEGEHKEYFWNFFYESFYMLENKSDLVPVKNFLILLFKLYILKTESELDMLNDIYNILDANLTVGE